MFYGFLIGCIKTFQKRKPLKCKQVESQLTDEELNAIIKHIGDRRGGNTQS
jgi:hypothetical protein